MAQKSAQQRERYMYTIGKQRHDWLITHAASVNMSPSELLRRLIDSVMLPPMTATSPSSPRRRKQTV